MKLADNWAATTLTPRTSGVTRRRQTSRVRPTSVRVGDTSVDGGSAEVTDGATAIRTWRRGGNRKSTEVGSFNQYVQNQQTADEFVFDNRRNTRRTATCSSKLCQ